MQSVHRCISCGAQYAIDQLVYVCPVCGGLLDIEHDLDSLRRVVSRELFDSRLGTLEMPYRSGVWRYKELVYPSVPNDLIVSRPEGNTNLYYLPRLARWAGLEHLWLKHEGENPTGSFKDRGMTGGVTQARVLGMTQVACASTGNTSASLASYAACGEMQAIVFFQEGQIALGKLAQTVAYGATCVQIPADFDTALRLTREVCHRLEIYLLNSVNPFRLEGQKTIIFELLQQLNWQVPDWIVVPGGNLGNSSSFGKALYELRELGLIDHLPRIAIIQAEGANPLYRGYKNNFATHERVTARTLATAIKIGDPVNYDKAVRTLRWTDGVAEEVSDQEILDAKAQIDASGIGCEPASACSLAGARKLVEAGVIKPGERVVGILTGHVLKDPGLIVDYHAGQVAGIHSTYANPLHRVEAKLEAVTDLLTRNRVI